LRYINTSGIQFERIGIALNKVAGNGPTIDCGYSYWWTLRNSTLGCNDTEAIGTDKRAVILCKPAVGHPSTGLFVVDNCVFNGGGIRYYCGTTTWGFVVRDLTLEGDFVNPVDTPIDIKEATKYGSVIIDMIEVADAPGTGASVKVTPADVPPDMVLVRRASLEGPGTILGNHSVGEAISTPAGERQQGFWQGRVAAQHDSARRAFSPTAARFANLAPQDVSTWAAKSGSATVTTGKSAPDGSTNAAELTSAGGVVNKEIFRGGQTFAVGDWIIAGVWLRGVNTANGPLNALIATTSVVITLDLTQSGSFVLASPAIGDGEWEWVCRAGKILSGSGAGDLVMALQCEPNKPTQFYAPMLLRIPNGTVSDNEALEYAQHLQSYPSAAPVGHVSTLRGQKLITHGGLGVGNSVAATTPGSVVKKMQVFDETGASLGYVPIYSAIT
jgi:hypothetical protein